MTKLAFRLAKRGRSLMSIRERGQAPPCGELSSSVEARIGSGMKLSHLLFAAALAACSPPQAAETAPAAQAEVVAATTVTPGVGVEFMAPSGNIGCSYTPAGGTAVYETADGRAELKCDRSEPEYVRVVMSETGAARVEPTDERGCCSGETIQYGQSWSEGPFSCDVNETGVTCTNRERHGFSLSRSQVEVH